MTLSSLYNLLPMALTLYLWTCLKNCDVQILMIHSISSHLIYDNEHISECLNFDLVLRTSCKHNAKNVIVHQKKVQPWP